MSVLKINEELFIGSGGHQATYIHPIDPHKCIKIPHMKDDGDVKKEMRYRRMCAKKLAESKLVTEFFGQSKQILGLVMSLARIRRVGDLAQIQLKVWQWLDKLRVHKLRNI